MTTITWTAGNGSKIEVTLEATYGYTLSGNVKTSGRKEIDLRVYIDGKEESQIGGLKRNINHPVAVAQIGRLLITRENLARIDEAYAAVEASIADHNAEVDRHVAELDAITDNSRKIERKMAYGESY
jgi:hypothetical protein